MTSVTNRGFTVAEIVTVLGIIFVLMAVVIPVAMEFRKAARDTQRTTDLAQIQVATRLYAEQNGTYQIANTGYNDGSQGWFSFEGGQYNVSVMSGLQTAGFLPGPVHDPLIDPNTTCTNSGGGPCPYMYYAQVGGFTNGGCIFAQLEEPTAEQTATMNDTKIPSATRTMVMDQWSMNYAVCH